MNRKWGVSAAVIAALWLVALGGRCALRNGRETAEKTAAFAAAHEPSTLAASERERAVEAFIARVNRLSFDERQRLGSDRRAQRFFEALNELERARVFEETLPSGMSEVIESFNRMEEAERKAFVERASRRMDRVVRDMDRAARNPEERERMEAAMNAIAREGLRAYLRDADAQAKLDLQPLMVQMQTMMQRAQW